MCRLGLSLISVFILIYLKSESFGTVSFFEFDRVTVRGIGVLLVENG